MTQTLTHPWQPIYDQASRVLVLGTFPSPRSRLEGFYFGHPQNIFWATLAGSLGVPRLPADASAADKAAMLLSNNVALWDVLQSCRIQGAADASILDPVPNRFSQILSNSRINAVFTTGRTATRLFNRLAADEAGMRAAYLPSTSPAARAAQASPEFLRLWGNVGRVQRGELVSAAGMKAADRYTIEQLGIASLTLMERAAQACVSELVHDRAAAAAACPSSSPNRSFDLSHVLCVCGIGNNGGDGLAVARLLRSRGIQASALVVGDTARLTADAAQQLAWAEELGVPVAFNELSAITDGTRDNAAGSDSGPPTTLVDALFGIGLARPLAAGYRQAVCAINMARERGAAVLSVDIPSGVNADSGEALGAAVKADITVTFARSKLGLTLGDGQACAGVIKVVDIGIALPGNSTGISTGNSIGTAGLNGMPALPLGCQNDMPEVDAGGNSANPAGNRGYGRHRC
jgi:hypoxanthine-DNA glycosylase